MMQRRASERPTCGIGRYSGRSIDVGEDGSSSTLPTHMLRCSQAPIPNDSLDSRQGRHWVSQHVLSRGCSCDRRTLYVGGP